MSLHDAARKSRHSRVTAELTPEEEAAAAFADWCLHQSTPPKPTIYRDSLQRKDHGHSRS